MPETEHSGEYEPDVPPHVIVECDHLRPLVWQDDGWHHLMHDGRVGGLCGASSAYRVRVKVLDPHNTGCWQADHFGRPGGPE